MCFNYKASLFAFSIGIIFSILLIYCGNPKYSLENKISGIFFIFISFIQFMDFLLWIDIKNNRNDDATFYRFDSKLFYIIRKYNGSGVANVNEGDS